MKSKLVSRLLFAFLICQPLTKLPALQAKVNQNFIKSLQTFARPSTVDMCDSMVPVTKTDFTTI
jgi:hypothetical protein